ncbi:hypothetical protein GE09DRAFT_253814 [Coniochaeta sp. 2T2.1]|nr:hypothetical protein GE09DRAFT_253814 [Coniochaeta sp. 2T2.1]
MALCQEQTLSMPMPVPFSVPNNRVVVLCPAHPPASVTTYISSSLCPRSPSFPPHQHEPSGKYPHPSANIIFLDQARPSIMEDNNTNPPPGLFDTPDVQHTWTWLPVHGHKDSRSVLIQAMIPWIAAHNPYPNSPAEALDTFIQALDTFAQTLANRSLSDIDIPAHVKATAPFLLDHMDEDKLKSLFKYAAKLSVTDTAAAGEAAKTQEAFNKLRCWTSGNKECTCVVRTRLVEGVVQHEEKVMCEMDCPKGCSADEITAELGAVDALLDSTAVCNRPGCGCMLSEEDQSASGKCEKCGSVTCVCAFDDWIDWDGGGGKTE